MAWSELLGMIVSPGNSRHIPDAIATDPTLRPPAPYLEFPIHFRNGSLPPHHVLMCSIRHGFSHLESVSHFSSSL